MKIIINTEAIQDKSISYSKLADDVAISITAEITDSAPETLDTLNELAAALGDDPNFATTIVTELSNKADTSGYYPKLKVGTANDLSGRNDVTEGFIGFRESAGAGNSIDDGIANVQELLGESLVWNQRSAGLISNSSSGTTITQLSNGLYRVEVAQGTQYGGASLSNSKTAPVIGHKYAVKLELTSSEGLNLNVFGERRYLLTEGTEFICTASATAVTLLVPAATSEAQVVSFDARLLLTDLTLMFGVGKEPSTIEEFEAIKNQLVGIDFIAYNAGEVLGVNIKGIKSVNDNAWDEEWEGGSLSTVTGLPTTASSAIRAKDFIKILSSYDYYVTAPTEIQENIRLYFYDADKNFIERGFDVNKVFTTPTNAHYMKLIVNNTTTYNHDICIRLYHTGYKTDYVAHEESESSFDITPYFPDGMHGINGVRDSVTKSKAVRRFGMVKMKDLNWTYSETYNGFVGYTDAFSHTANAIKREWQGISTKYPYNGSYSKINDKEMGYIFYYHVLVKDSAYADVASFIASLTDDDILIYELATPIETTIDPQLNMNYKVWDFGTEELLTDSKSAPVLARTIYGFNATDTIRGNKAKIEEHDARIDALEKEVVRVGDYQPDLSVGVADNLVGTQYNEAEISFRRSGDGAILDGTARLSSVKGNSVVWNQLSTTTELNQSYNSESLPTGASVIQGHKYAMIFDSVDARLYLYTKIDGTNQIIASSQDGKSLIFTSNYSATSVGSTSDGLWWFVLNMGSATTYSIKNIRLTDLTLMFGTGNEPTTIEEFYARKPKVVDENAFNEGEVIHMEADAIKSVGVNQWDEEWELGTFMTDGTNASSNEVIRTKNFIPCIGGAKYVCNQNLFNGLLFFDADKKLIKWEYPSANSEFTIPINAAYMRFKLSSAYGTTYKNDICVNLSDPEVNGKYFPYINRELSLEMTKKYFPNGMKSAGTAHDEIKWNDQKQKWEAIKRIGEVDMGTLNWSRLLATDRYHFTVPIQGILPATSATYTSNILQSKYAFDKSSGTTTQEDKTIRRWGSGIYIRDDAFTDATTFKAAMSGVMLYYELAEPIVTEIDENFNLDYDVWNDGTEQMIADTPSTPIKASIAYGFNAVGKIKQLEEIIAQLQTAIANLSNS